MKLKPSITYRETFFKTIILPVLFISTFLLPQEVSAVRLDYTTKLYEISTATGTTKALDVTAQEGNPVDIVFNNTGTKVYVLGFDGNDFTQYNLSTPYDISTASSNSVAFTMSNVHMINPRSMLFNNTGTRLYVLDADSGPAFAGKIQQYNLSTAFDISTAVYNSLAFNVNAQENAPTDMIFNNNGTVLYVLGMEGDQINKYNLGTAYNIATAVFSSMVLDVTAQETTPRGMVFNSDGYRLYVIGNTQNRAYMYNLTTPYDIGTATFSASALNVTSQDDGTRDILFNNLGDKVYVVGVSGDEINQYFLGVANTKFVEAVANDGSVTGQLGFVLNGDTFNDPDNDGILTSCGGSVVCAGHQVQITNLPAGFTPTVTIYRADSVTVNTIDTGKVGILTLTGNATNHQNIHDLAALTFTFANSAFNSTAAASVTNAISASGGVGIDFENNITFPVMYDGNSNTGGSIPVDALSPYVSGATVTVLGNIGSLIRTGHIFNNWNTTATGSGTVYAPAATFSITGTTTLYAQWTALTSATVVVLDNLTNESGDTGTFSIVLDSAPSADVIIALSSSNIAEGTVQASVTFTALNWNVPQIITVTGVDDILSDGSQSFSIVTGDVTSADLAYDALDGTSITDTTFSNQDNDAPGIFLNVVSTSTSEGGGTATIQVSLLSQPGGGADVTIPLSVSDGTEGSVPASITILNADWNVPGNNIITITGLDDVLVDGNIIYTLVTGDPTSLDLGYDGLSAALVADVTMVNLDNDVTITYNGNTNTGGSVPIDGSSPYVTSSSVTVLGNTGTLVKTGFTFNNWNTAANGSGTAYAPATTFTISANTVLYAQWTALPTYTATYNGNSNTGGSVPVDALSPYDSSSTVTVLGNTGSLVRTGFTFNNWNTAANGSGTAYAPAAAFTIGANTTLFAQWSDTTPPSDPTVVSISPNPAATGTLVTLTLSGVETGATITVDDFTCTPTTADATGIVTCTATIGAAYDGSAKQVTVTDAAGNANTNVYSPVVTISAAAVVTPSTTQNGGSIVAPAAQYYSNGTYIQGTPSVFQQQVPRSNLVDLLGGEEPNVPSEFSDYVCKRYMKEYILPGGNNNPVEVKKLQEFLNLSEGEKLALDGTYDADDIEAVKRFQNKYKDQIMAPWGLTEATGRVLRTTTAKINILLCATQKGCPYFSSYLKEGDTSLDAVKVQDFLNVIFAPISGYPTNGLELSKEFNSKTKTIVKDFQTVYKEIVLKPWGLTSATGWWYKTTRHAANKLMNCTEGGIILDNGIKVE